MKTVVIAIPARNSAATIRPTLDSALAQTYRELRIVVVDNASEDDTAAITREYSARDSRVELKTFSDLVSAEENFNRCLALAEGALVAILHADDVYEPEMIAEQVAFLDRHPECAIVFTHANTIDSKGTVTGERFFPRELRGTNVILNFEDLRSLVVKYGNFITCPSALMRSHVVGFELRGWNGKDFGSSADLDLWLRVAQRAAVGFISKPLMRYRISEHSFSVALQKVRTVRHPMFKVIESHLDGELDPITKWRMRFLEAKDASLVALNHMKRNESLDVTRPRLSIGNYVLAFAHSDFHRRFAFRMAAIGIFERLYGIGACRPLISGVIARVKA